MKNNQYRQNRVLKNFLKNNNLNKNDSISLKDILIPLISALLAVTLNQFFFESNKITESKIELHKESLKAQTPVLNRILSFTYKYEIAVLTCYTIPIHHIVYKDSTTGKIIKEFDQNGKTDSVIVYVPTFVVDTVKRKKLLSDLEVIRKQQDYLDHEIYIAFDELVDFLNETPFPKNNTETPKSKWANKTTSDQWTKLVDKLRTVCYTKLNEFENSSS